MMRTASSLSMRLGKPSMAFSRPSTNETVISACSRCRLRSRASGTVMPWKPTRTAISARSRTSICRAFSSSISTTRTPGALEMVMSVAGPLTRTTTVVCRRPLSHLAQSSATGARANRSGSDPRAGAAGNNPSKTTNTRGRRNDGEYEWSIDKTLLGGPIRPSSATRQFRCGFSVPTRSDARTANAGQIFARWTGPGHRIMG